MTIVENGVVQIFCDEHAVKAPIAGCKCAGCKEARQIHRYKRSTVVAAPNTAILANVGRKRGEAWRKAKDPGPFRNTIKGLAKIADFMVENRKPWKA